MIYVAAKIYIATICQPPQASVAKEWKKMQKQFYKLRSYPSIAVFY